MAGDAGHVSQTAPDISHYCLLVEKRTRETRLGRRRYASGFWSSSPRRPAWSSRLLGEFGVTVTPVNSDWGRIILLQHIFEMWLLVHWIHQSGASWWSGCACHSFKRSSVYSCMDRLEAENTAYLRQRRGTARSHRDLTSNLTIETISARILRCDVKNKCPLDDYSVVARFLLRK